MTNTANKMSLKDRAKMMESNLPLMNGRVKGDMKRIMDMPVTIRDYGFMKDPTKDDDKDYVAFIVDEDPETFYFGGQVLTEDMHELDEDGYHDDIVASGLPVLFGKKTSVKSKKEYTTVQFYPDAK